MKNSRIYTQQSCSFCTEAKQLLIDNDIDFEEISLHFPRGLSLFRADCPDSRTVPQVFIDNVFIGNFNNLKEYFK